MRKYQDLNDLEIEKKIVESYYRVLYKEKLGNALSQIVNKGLEKYNKKKTENSAFLEMVDMFDEIEPLDLEAYLDLVGGELGATIENKEDEYVKEIESLANIFRKDHVLRSWYLKALNFRYLLEIDSDSDYWDINNMEDPFLDNLMRIYINQSDSTTRRGMGPDPSPF